jgi:hypothetical protein
MVRRRPISRPPAPPWACTMPERGALLPGVWAGHQRVAFIGPSWAVGPDPAWKARGLAKGPPRAPPTRWMGDARGPGAGRGDTRPRAFCAARQGSTGGPPCSHCTDHRGSPQGSSPGQGLETGTPAPSLGAGTPVSMQREQGTPIQVSPGMPREAWTQRRPEGLAAMWCRDRPCSQRTNPSGLLRDTSLMASSHFHMLRRQQHNPPPVA